VPSLRQTVLIVVAQNLDAAPDIWEAAHNENGDAHA
jgi:hypothetical protein